MSHPIPIRVQVTLPVLPGMTETNHRGEEFVPAEVTHDVGVFGGTFCRYVTVDGRATDDTGNVRSRLLFVSDNPEDAERAARYPQPGPWSEQVVEQMRQAVAR